MKGFPELAQNELFIAGESYAGAYVPMLALEIIKHNKAADRGAVSHPLQRQTKHICSFLMCSMPPPSPLPPPASACR